MKKYLLPLFLTLLLLPLINLEALAQENRTPYTGNNTIIVSLEGIGQRYEFISDQLLVRHNETTHRLECVLPIASLIPLNDTIPPAMAYEVLFGAKYPELHIMIEAPEQQAGTGRFTPANRGRTTSISLQGVNNETIIPVAFQPEKNTFYFSTNFDLMLDNFQASMPVKYLPILTGRVLFSIERAQWYNLRQQ
ncbi:hypothetical protein DXT99_02160 [Pontibacter diazotrophicus]|uniref:YceI family protein n=1 Tax=Pontibacter diazotrophicus TaxID=1400979 RepID=A0A3D8LGR4_9BACT|nr:hypothetical protein [Pontibacter diazotrophicus]RDV16610.1 hypothetical protein DXT99_02160 [Pontibacter diazotrophicus]